METLDIIIVCCFLPALYFGIKNGFVKQVISIAVIYFGISLSIKFSDPVSEWILTKVELSPFILKTISFVLIFSVIALLLNLIGRLIEKIIKIAMLGWLNRVLGVVAAFCAVALVVSLLAFLFNQANELAGFVNEEKISESVLFPKLLDFANTVFPYLKQLFQNP